MKFSKQHSLQTKLQEDDQYEQDQKANLDNDQIDDVANQSNHDFDTYSMCSEQTNDNYNRNHNNLNWFNRNHILSQKNKDNFEDEIPSVEYTRPMNQSEETYVLKTKYRRFFDV